MWFPSGDHLGWKDSAELVTNSLIGIIQELRAKRTLDRLEVLAAPSVLNPNSERHVGPISSMPGSAASNVRLENSTPGISGGSTQ